MWRWILLFLFFCPFGHGRGLSQHRYSIGQSVEGRDLSVTLLTACGDGGACPDVRYIANMHGDETLGHDLLLKLTQYLPQQYEAGDERVQRLLNTTRIHIMPTMNPDGYAHGTRHNANGYDLNRNFPDQYLGQRTPLQPETSAVMAWSLRVPFVLSANLHGGALCANYPFDGNVARRNGIASPTPDDDVFRELALTYSRAHTTMHLSSVFADGITNGAAWYVLYGGLQDWMYLNTPNAMEITLELSYVKHPHMEITHWDQNRNALLAYLERVQQHVDVVHGQVRDATSGEGISGVRIGVRKSGESSFTHRRTVVSDERGYFWRLVGPGEWDVMVGATQFRKHATERLSVSVQGY